MRSGSADLRTVTVLNLSPRVDSPGYLEVNFCSGHKVRAHDVRSKAVDQTMYGYNVSIDSHNQMIQH